MQTTFTAISRRGRRHAEGAEQQNLPQHWTPGKAGPFGPAGGEGPIRYVNHL